MAFLTSWWHRRFFWLEIILIFVSADCLFFWNVLLSRLQRPTHSKVARRGRVLQWQLGTLFYWSCFIPSSLRLSSKESDGACWFCSSWYWPLSSLSSWQLWLSPVDPCKYHIDYLGRCFFCLLKSCFCHRCSCCFQDCILLNSLYYYDFGRFDCRVFCALSFFF